MSAVTQSRVRLPDLATFRGGRAYLWLVGLSLILAAVSLHWPSTPSYDPWSWLIWGREIFHAITGSGPAVDSSLHITGGSSWKPLPVIFTTVFALFGSAQPNLWLLVARAGAALTVLMSVKLAMRITWGLVTQTSSGARLSAQSRLSHAVAITPAVLAGVMALICTAFTRSFPLNMLLGYSEGVMAAVFLIAVERAWDGHFRQAFALGIIPCLDRPEVWPIWGLFGLWLMWRDRGARLLVIGLGLLMLCLWGVPQKLGGGSGGLIGLGSHALKNHSRKSAVFASFPFWAELSKTLWPLVIARLEIASLAFSIGTGYVLWRTRRRLGSWTAAVRRHSAATAAALAGLFGFLWWLSVAAETQAGFAGNPRYAVMGAMFICISGCSAYGWACIGLAEGIAGGLRLLRRRSRWRYSTTDSQFVWLAAATTLVVLVVFALVPHRFTTNMPTVNGIRYQLRYQAELRERYAYLVRDAGGPQKVMSCGSVQTNNYQVTMLAWYLQVPIRYVQAQVKAPTVEPGPNVVFQARASSGAPIYPNTAFLRDWSQGWQTRNGSQYKIMNSPPVTLYMNCSTYSGT
jgi:hypothetical protein